jgi:hypothetical protein
VRCALDVAVGALCRPPGVSGGGVDVELTAGQFASGQELCDLLSIPARTLKRWRTWWREDFPATPFWQSMRERFMPPVVTERLPHSCWNRFDERAMIGSTDAGAALDRAVEHAMPIR